MIPYNGKFSHGAKFRGFADRVAIATIKTTISEEIDNVIVNERCNRFSHVRPLYAVSDLVEVA